MRREDPGGREIPITNDLALGNSAKESKIIAELIIVNSQSNTTNEDLLGRIVHLGLRDSLLRLDFLPIDNVRARNDPLHCLNSRSDHKAKATRAACDLLAHDDNAINGLAEGLEIGSKRILGRSEETKEGKRRDGRPSVLIQERPPTKILLRR